MNSSHNPTDSGHTQAMRRSGNDIAMLQTNQPQWSTMSESHAVEEEVSWPLGTSEPHTHTNFKL